MPDGAGGAGLTYFLSKRDGVYGPLDIEEIMKRIRGGSISSREWIFLPDPGEWYPIIEIPQLAAGFYSLVEKPTTPPAGVTGTPVSPTTLAHIGSEKVEFGGQMVEKRRWIRLPSTLTLRFAIDNAGIETAQKTFETVTDDLSEGGLGFNWHEEIPIGTFVRVELDIFPHLLKTKGRVARNRPLKEGQFHIGVLFVSLHEQDHKNLKEFISTAISTSS